MSKNKKSFSKQLSTYDSVVSHSNLEQSEKEQSLSPIKSIFHFFKNSAREMSSVIGISITAMLLALRAITGYFSIYLSPAIRLGFTFLPIALTGMIYGPVAGGVVGGLGDVLGYILNSSGGAYFPGYTISGVLTGVIYGIFFYRQKITIGRVVLAKLTNLILIELLLTTLWVQITTGDAYFVIMAGRLVKCLVCFPIEAAIIYFVGKVLSRVKLPISRKI